MSDLPAYVDVAIVGAGPAGLAAAAELKSLGIASVLVLERSELPGGVPRYCGHSPFGLREFGRPMRGRAYAEALARRARTAGADIRTSATVAAIGPGPFLTVSTDTGTGRLRARAVLVATGVRESTRATRLIGGSKPGGVMVTGALQNLVYGAGMVPFRRPVILGTELVAFSAILTCRHAGIRPVVMVEPAQRTTARFPAALLPRALGLPLRLETGVAAVEGRDRVTSVILSTPQGTEAVDADGLITTGRFTPETGLLRSADIEIDPSSGGPVVDEGGRTSMPMVYAAGNLLRPVETAGWCWSEARAIARTMVRDLGTDQPRHPTPIRLASDALKYAMPQRFSGDGAPALPRLQLRLTRPVQGTLSMTVDGRELRRQHIDSRPERRVFLPLPDRPGQAEIRLEEGR